MKFARQLEEYQLPEWKGCYLPYAFLKNCLHEVSIGHCETVVQQLQAALARMDEQGEREPLPQLQPSPVSERWPARQVSHSTAASDAVKDQAIQLWWRYIERETQRIATCVEVRHEQLSLQTAQLAAVRPERYSYLELQLLEGLQRVAQGLARLQSFAELNHAALYKIAKKHDKVLSSHLGLSSYLPRLVRVSCLADASRLESLEARLRSYMLQCSQCEGLEASPRVAVLVAGLSQGQERSGPSGLDPVRLRRERKLFFFLGSCVSLLLTIIILITLPVIDRKTFDSAYFLASFAVYRVVWSVALIFWCMGAVARVCDDHFVNHMFILSVDPRCHATASFFFGQAALLTSLWILLFGIYVLDYKWMLLPTELQVRHEAYRSSWHFVLYPSSLLCLMFLLLLLPSKTCRLRYKLQLLRCLGRTSMAPFYTVIFADNLAGDVLTSLAKPLEDIPAAICYLVSHHPQLPLDVQRFISDGDSCPRWVHYSINPLLAAAPFVFRLLQCARRFRDTREWKHLCNLGKYSASLLVLVVTRISAGPVIVITVSFAATVYAAVWDIGVDWGLDCAFLRSALTRRPRSASDVNAAAGPAGPAVADLPVALLQAQEAADDQSAPRGQSVAGSGVLGAGVSQPSNPAAAHPHTAQQAAELDKRHFSLRTYVLAACLDIVLRMTWVLTLIPVEVLSDNIIQRAVLQTSVSTMEILRRCMWTVLRIENEQVNNASGYRALHWVPLQMGPIFTTTNPCAATACSIEPSTSASLSLGTAALTSVSS